MTVENELLHYEDICFRRDGKDILRNLNWHVKKGENWALLGLNGAGKSTMLSFIPAYQTATSGTLRVLGEEFGKHIWADIKERVGFVSSSLNLFASTLDRQTIENVVISGAYASIGVYKKVDAAVKTKAQNLLETFNIIQHKDKTYGSCSMGQQRRALLARALMADPDLLIFDEPCAGLDLTGRELFLDTLETFQNKYDKAFVYVTHQIEEIVPAITHVAILKDGEMVFAGPKDQVITEEGLSNLYGLPIKIIWESGRPWVIVK